MSNRSTSVKRARTDVSLRPAKRTRSDVTLGPAKRVRTGVTRAPAKRPRSDVTLGPAKRVRTEVARATAKRGRTNNVSLKPAKGARTDRTLDFKRQIICDDDAEEDLARLLKLIGSDMSAEEYISIDDDIETEDPGTGDLGDDSSDSSEESDSESSEESDDDDVDDCEIKTFTQCVRSLDVIKRGEEGRDEVATNIVLDVEDRICEQSILKKPKNSVQIKLTTYFNVTPK